MGVASVVRERKSIDMHSRVLRVCESGRAIHTSICTHGPRWTTLSSIATVPSHHLPLHYCRHLVVVVVQDPTSPPIGKRVAVVRPSSSLCVCVACLRGFRVALCW